MKFFRTQEFIELNTYWRQQLKQSGFNDIEHESGKLKNSAKLRIYERYCPFKEEYYTRCRQYLTHGLFGSKLEFDIWQLHSEGDSSRQIAPRVGVSHETVCRRVKEVEARMNKMKLWKRDELPITLS